MKKNKVISYFVIIVLFILIFVFLPVIPIGKRLMFVNLSTGEEIIKISYLGNLFSSTQKRKTILTKNWPVHKAKIKNINILISTSIIYPFGGRKYITIKRGERYFKLKNYFLSQESNRNNKIIVKYIHKNAQDVAQDGAAPQIKNVNN